MTTGQKRIPFEGIASLLLHVHTSLGSQIPYRIFGSAALCSRCPTALGFRRELGFTDIDDIDVVVRPSHIDSASVALCASQYVRAVELYPEFRRVESQGSRRCFVWDHDSELQPHLLELWWEPIRCGECELLVDWTNDDQTNLLAIEDLLVYALQWPSFSILSEPTLAKRLKRALDIGSLLTDYPFDSPNGLSLDRVVRKLTSNCLMWRRAYCALPLVESLCLEYYRSQKLDSSRILKQCTELRRLIESRRIQGRCRIAYGRLRRKVPDFM